MANRKKAVLYTRTSTEDQALSLKAQLKTITEYCERNDIEIVGIFETMGISGGAPIEDRTTLLDAVAEVGIQGAHFLLVAKRDRLARDIVVSAMVERLVEENGGLVMSCDGVTAEQTPEGKMLRQMLDVFAEYERQMIKARTKAALHQKRLRGEKLGGRVPFGYMVENGRLVANKAEQRTIRRIRNLKGALSYDAVLEYLHTDGTMNRGKPFTRSTVVRICKRDDKNTGE